MTGFDRDHDGDYDEYDALHQGLIDNPASGLGQAAELRSDYFFQNVIHEFFEDVAEAFDDNPNNDSFTDGGNGSGNQTPLDPDYSPGGGIPVVLTFGDFTYSYLNGNFSLIDTGAGGGGGFMPF